MSHLPANRAQDLITDVVGYDATRAIKVLKLIKMAEDPDFGEEVKKAIYMQTKDCDEHCQDFIKRL